jgi:hypothetical protein
MKNQLIVLMLSSISSASNAKEGFGSFLLPCFKYFSAGGPCLNRRQSPGSKVFTA